KLKATRFVLDGRLVIPARGAGILPADRGKPLGFSFDDLLQRIHPAASRVNKLAKETPAHFIVFDLLVDEAGKPLVDLPLAKRRPKLESFARKYLKKNPDIELSPATKEVAVAHEWLST